MRGPTVWVPPSTLWTGICQNSYKDIAHEGETKYKKFMPYTQEYHGSAWMDNITNK